MTPLISVKYIPRPDDEEKKAFNQKNSLSSIFNSLLQ